MRSGRQNGSNTGGLAAISTGGLAPRGLRSDSLQETTLEAAVHR